MRILIRTSKSAILARRLSAVAVPAVVIALGLHHLRLIASDVFLVAALVAGGLALLAVLVSIFALGRLWYSGDRGWSKALLGLLLGTICLIPYGYYGGLAWRYPAVTDIATADRGLMPLLFEPGTAAMPTPRMLAPAEMMAQFPNVETRTYPLGLGPTFALVQAMVADNGWTVRLLREPGEAGQVNAQIVTLPGWREEVVIRVTGTQTEAQVDMRSASLNALHDFGSNGQRIEAFLAALDDAVTTTLRDNPNANAPVEADVDIEVPDSAL